ncbi:hypothetical protein PF008_g1152 [Phytophthora fragariae]|uniref:Uncharacterized protein n=1 Tax=Phytophthora fragariae TaxID=53985 RepID=A0A6G0SKT9_9STRA|nr:hypothetical protein PF008_g1152 [Phytophthora fragariae]
MTKPRTRSTTAPSATAIAKELRARLDADDDDEHATLRAQVALWDRIRPTLAANDASVGLEALDALVVSVLAEDDELPPLLDRTVVIVPHPDASVRGVVPAHPLFSFVASPYYGKRPSARSSSKAAGPAKKKQRQLRRAPSILQNLPAHVSAKLRTDHEQLEQAAAELGTVVVRLAYRWVVLDVQGKDPPYPNWVGNTNRGDWKKLLASEDLQATIDEVEQLLVNDEPVAVFNQKRFQDTEKGEDESDYEVDGLPTIRPPTSRKTSASPTPKSAQKKKRVPSGLTESEASEGESSDAEPDDKPSDKTPKGSLYESSDDDDVEEEADSSTNDKADKEAAATPGSSAGPKTPSSGDDKSGGKGHDKGRDKNPRKTP